MRDADLVEFLQWALPRMKMRWAGYRRVRGQVRKRLARRLSQLGLPDLDAYKARLETQAREWDRLDDLCRITVSRFYRDRALWDHLGEVLLPELSALADRRGDADLRCWSIGCASGEEPYTLALVWQWKMDAVAQRRPLRVLAVDADERLLNRARRGIYDPSSLRDLPGVLRNCFIAEGKRFRIDDAYRDPITFVHQDVRSACPPQEFHLVLVRNLVFTYYDESLQRLLQERLVQRLVPGGALVLGIHESLPVQAPELSVRDESLGIYARVRGTES